MSAMTVESDLPPRSDVQQIANGSCSNQEGNEMVLEPREKWAKKIQFLLGCCGFSVGLGNVWRFPYLCYRDGGGAFLIPYFICVLFGAIPMFVLEIAMGQYTSQGGITCWDLVPILKGVGYACQLILFMHNIYYNVILAWGFYYFFASFTTVLPWSHCDNEWNTPKCSTGANYSANSSAISVSRHLAAENGVSASPVSPVSLEAADPVTEYWQHHVLGLSSGIGEIGGVKWDLALCLLLSWVLIYFCIWKGIKWTGKVMYVTVTAPYVFMIILLIRGATLPGAGQGIRYYLIPDFSKLGNTRVWIGAATQVFFSYSMCLGNLTALGSFNKFHHNFFKDSILFAIINSGTSLLAGFVIFSVLGYMATEHNIPIDQVAESGPGLAFIAYPKAVAQLPGAPVWSILFFIMLLLLGMDSQFGGVEGSVTAIIDVFPHYLRRPYAREIFVAVICAVSYIVGLAMCTKGGMYVFLLFDYYSQARIVLLIAFFEVIAVSWVYGAQRFHENMELMLGRKLWPHLKYCWLVITPLFNLIFAGLCFYNYDELTYNRTYHYPRWAINIGWVMAFSSVLLIPLVALYKLYVAEGSLIERVQWLSQPQLKNTDHIPGADNKLHITVNNGLENEAYKSYGDSTISMNSICYVTNV